MISELIGHKDYIRILQVLRYRGSLRFGQIETLLDLNPVQVDRALKFLCEGSLIHTHSLPAGKGKGLQYELARRGTAFLEAFESFTGDIYSRGGELGLSEVADFRALYLPDKSRLAEPAVKIDHVIKIGPVPESETETETMRNYRAACLKLSPKERIARMRSHSRRMILLNPANPRSPHIIRGVIRITHDAV
jgi:hypothetical protein